MNNKPDILRTEARQDLLTGLALGAATDAGRGQHFRQSQHWQGYKEAFDSWTVAMWKWIDEDVTPEQENVWRAKLLAERGRFSPVSDYTAPASEHDIEHYLQSYLVRRAYFLGGLRHKKENDPNWFKAFGFYFFIASLLDDDVLFREMARLTQRKTSQKQLGKRSLQFWIRFLWIPGCFWAITNSGIIDRLVRRNSDLRYGERSVRNAVSKLELWRPDTPLYWGFDSNGRLVSLR
jgi:hypothetical protein